MLLASASPLGSSEADQLSHEVRGFDSVPVVPDGLQLTRVARQGPFTSGRLGFVNFGKLVFPPTPLF